MERRFEGNVLSNLGEWVVAQVRETDPIADWIHPQLSERQGTRAEGLAHSAIGSVT